MLAAKVNGRLIKASSDSPEVAQCPECGGEVRKRKRKIGRNGDVFFYRHRRGVGNDCPLRYRPTK
jgi:ssDNA-binding Zn-finger/Zn-ribbon topoisomerase 1